MNLAEAIHQLGRLNADEPELVRRWPKARDWINRVDARGETAPVPEVKHRVIGPVYRPFELSHRPTAEQLSHEPEALRPWICRIDGRNVYLSEEIFPRLTGLRHTKEELQAASKRLMALLNALPPFYAHFGGAGDALLASRLLLRPESPIQLFFHIPMASAQPSLFDAFPKLSKIYYLPQQAEHFFHAVLHYTAYQFKNCLGAGATPQFGYEEEWKAGLDIEKKYKINKSPGWISDFKKNAGSRRVALGPQRQFDRHGWL